jgi:hypothetical protein
MRLYQVCQSSKPKSIPTHPNVSTGVYGGTSHKPFVVKTTSLASKKTTSIHASKPPPQVSFVAPSVTVSIPSNSASKRNKKDPPVMMLASSIYATISCRFVVLTYTINNDSENEDGGSFEEYFYLKVRKCCIRTIQQYNTL